MTDERVAALARNLRAEGYLDNDPDAVLAAIRLVALADAMAVQQNPPATCLAAEAPLPT